MPSLLRTLLDIFDDLERRLPELRLWFAGGEMLPSDLCQHFQASLPQRRLVNLYGVSEVSDDVTAYDTRLLPQRSARVPIGHPISNLQVYVLDRYLQPVPTGVAGELYIGGVGLTRGYLNRSALTAQRFLPHPFSPLPGARLYQAGDLVRYAPDGHLEFFGRLDHQIKLRGIRIELGEIETALNQHPAVHETVVDLDGDAAGEARLVAYMVPAQDQEVPTVQELRSFLNQTLPVSLIPSGFVPLAAFPRTPSGKINRRALPAPDRSRPGLTVPFTAPRSLSEHRVAAIWSELLHVEEIGIDDNFFELGGHSLLATQLLSRIFKTLGVEVSLLRFFENPTVADLSQHVEMAGDAQPHRVPTIAAISRERPLPASIDQERMWSVIQMLPDLPLFNMTHLVRLQGIFEIHIFEQCLHHMMQRHEILRTTFTSIDGQLIQVVNPTADVELAEIDLRTVPSQKQTELVKHISDREVEHPFDLEKGPLLRVHLLHLDVQEYCLLITMHHLISDGWSMGIFVHELGLWYDHLADGIPLSLPDVVIQYADFADWQRQWQQSEMIQKQFAYWQKQLVPLPPVLRFNTDGSQNGTMNLQSERQYFECSQELYESLKHLSSQA